MERYSWITKIDLNKWATAITIQEGKKHSLKIGDVKEVMKLFIQKLAKATRLQQIELIERYAKRMKTKK